MVVHADYTGLEKETELYLDNVITLILYVVAMVGLIHLNQCQLNMISKKSLKII